MVSVVVIDALARYRNESSSPNLLTNRSVIASPRLGRVLSTAAVAIFALFVCYAVFVSLRDTHTMFFYPEVGWNASEFNARSVSIEATSLTEYLKDLVGEEGPVVSEYFDLYIMDGTLIYFRNDCSMKDMEERVRLRIEPISRLDLIGFRKSSGLNRLDFYPLRQGAVMDGKCPLVAPLPQYRIANVTTGQTSAEGVELWQTTFVP